MTLSSIAYGYYNNQNTPDQVGQPIDMKKMAYITPVIFMFVMNSLPAGMSFYYFVSNLVTILQQIGIRKLLTKIKSNRFWKTTVRKSLLVEVKNLVSQNICKSK
jgi:YidC/Oxa1 family membrane protein insertase